MDNNRVFRKLEKDRKLFAPPKGDNERKVSKTDNSVDKNDRKTR
jgi:hypothetical protein